MSAATALLLAVLSAAAAILAVLVNPSWISRRVFADLVLTNATIYTSDPSVPFAQAMAVRGGRVLRVSTNHQIRIEHAQHLVPGTVFRFGQQKIVASVQPDHLLSDAYSAERKIGIDRANKGSYLFRSLLDGGAKLAFGSDWPVVDINPLGGIRTAVTRVPPGRLDAWIPSERVGLSDALNAHTISAAYACFLDQYLGSLSPGKYADFVVLPVTSWDHFMKEIPNTVVATYVNGVQAYP